MCGIAGILLFESKESISLASLKIMTDAIAHRGPDGEGQWVDPSNGIGLGHRRLSIIDLTDAGAQPMHYIGRYSITFNGEIYNYIELRQELEQKGIVFHTHTDTEVLLALYHLEGEACLNRLDGMWAFAIWDSEKKELFCARDRFGEKPFFYYQDNKGFYFASEMKALWAVGIPRTSNDEMFEKYIDTGVVYDSYNLSKTFYENIYQLPHSHNMIIHKKGVSNIVRYYDINWKIQSFKGSPKDAQIIFKKLLVDSIKKRFRSDVPLGTSLSGGLDSSSIVCAISQELANNNKLETFSARFKNFIKDEGVFIDEVIKKTSYINHSVWPSEEDLQKDWDKLCSHQEEPFGSTSIYAQYCVFKLAKQFNITVLVDGQGADEILAGYPFYYYNLMLYNIANKPFLKAITQLSRYIDIHSNTKGLKKIIEKFGILFYIRNRKQIKKSNLKSLNQLLYESTMKGPLQELLNYADRNSMAHSIEIRLPFLSKELVEFCFSLPDEYKLHNGWTKKILRESLSDILPKSIAWRKDKIGFETPQSNWIQKMGSNWKQIMIDEFRK